MYKFYTCWCSLLPSGCSGSEGERPALGAPAPGGSSAVPFPRPASARLGWDPRWASPGQAWQLCFALLGACFHLQSPMAFIFFFFPLPVYTRLRYFQTSSDKYRLWKGSSRYITLRGVGYWYVKLEV